MGGGTGGMGRRHQGMVNLRASKVQPANGGRALKPMREGSAGGAGGVNQPVLDAVAAGVVRIELAPSHANHGVRAVHVAGIREGAGPPSQEVFRAHGAVALGDALLTLHALLDGVLAQRRPHGRAAGTAAGEGRGQRAVRQWQLCRWWAPPGRPDGGGRQQQQGGGGSHLASAIMQAIRAASSIFMEACMASGLSGGRKVVWRLLGRACVSV